MGLRGCVCALRDDGAAAAADFRRVLVPRLLASFRGIRETSAMHDKSSESRSVPEESGSVCKKSK